MTPSERPDDRLSKAEQACVDELCDAFEAEWQRLARPKIEEYIDGAKLEIRSQLLEELVKIDHHWRLQESDPDVIRSEYVRRFPGDTKIVEQILGSSDSQTSQAPHPSLLPNNTSLGPFLNLRQIGEGGFGVVFRAWDSRHQRDVALKIPRFVHSISGPDLNRFLREAKSAGRLDHSGIARVWDSGTISGIAYIAYQFVDGENLKARFDEVNGWPTSQVVTFIRRLAEAVHFAHEHDIVHRDIKPSNILVTADGRPVLTDFGLALATSGDATRSLAARVGTIDYMSPEQASGAGPNIDRRADLWSLGVVTYQLLANELPFHGATDVEVLRSIQRDDPKALRVARRDVSLDLSGLVMRCLQKRPDDRLASCGFLADELGRMERGEPILSRPISFVERSYRWTRRNRRAVATFSAILLATVFGTWSWTGWILANREGENAVQELQIELESAKVIRRELLGSVLRGGSSNLNLTNEDLLFVEERFLTTTNGDVRNKAAELMLSHERFRTPRFRAEQPDRQRCLELLRTMAGDETIEEEFRARLSNALKELEEPMSNEPR